MLFEIDPDRKIKYKNNYHKKSNLNLVGKHSVFDEEKYKKYDIPAREILKDVLGDFLIENPDIYHQDFIINSKNLKYKYLEVQVCADWLNIEYPYPKVWVYERKGKYGKDTLFLTLNRMMTRGMLFDREAFEDKPRRIRKYSKEYVYDIKWNRVIKVVVSELDELLFEFY